MLKRKWRLNTSTVGHSKIPILAASPASWLLETIAPLPLIALRRRRPRPRCRAPSAPRAIYRWVSHVSESVCLCLLSGMRGTSYNRATGTILFCHHSIAYLTHSPHISPPVALFTCLNGRQKSSTVLSLATSHPRAYSLSPWTWRGQSAMPQMPY